MNPDDVSNLSDRVDIISTEDERLKTIGEILSSDSSRSILKLLFNQSLSANEIAQKTEMSLPLVIHHLKKMQSVQIIKIRNIGKNSKSHDMKYYTIDKFAIVILPSEMTKPAKKSKSLFNSFTRIHRLATLGGVSIAVWFSSQLIQNQSIISENTKSKIPPIADESTQSMMRSIPEQTENMQEFLQTGISDPQIGVLWSAVMVLSVIISGLVIELIIKQKTNRTIIPEQE
ncbi:MAG: winged helix-turn-helix domain-containing protein [Nitrosopumilus sp.]|nr:winged helix-turn-helix domain-containing protein [Nitrosopumilus sp.]MDH3515826.1 winged helix-turn-helix domain-containing protein [Nitrosopumilus sp.]MDH5416700.1 winged helix-turn-helix domain-containing protein [Nitrosopumilus sp.]MDH5554434.1 winged helix-turn-helix domain-containing protein [Nitrosopumilus sp.]